MKHHSCFDVLPVKCPSPSVAAVLVGMALFASTAGADEPVNPRPETPLPAARRHLGDASSRPAAFEAATLGDWFTSPALLQWGITRLQPHVLYRFTHADGLNSRPGLDRETDIHTFEAGVGLAIRDRWQADYTAVRTVYTAEEFRDSTEHSFRLAGEATFEAWDFQLAHNDAWLRRTLAETGAQTKHESHTTAVYGSRPLGSQFGLDLSVRQSLRFAEEFNDAADWSTMDWLYFSAAPGLNAAVGLGLGYVDVDRGSDMTYEHFLGRVKLAATRKISFDVQAGVEMRQLKDSDEDVSNPIFGASMSYAPFETTLLTVSTSRSVGSSYFRNQITEREDFRLGLHQRLLEHFLFKYSVSYSNSSYVSTIDGKETGRDDDRYSHNLSLGTTVRQRINLSVFYRHDENSSTDQAFDYTSDQYGIQIAFN